jgi:hypothetical protein
MGVLKVGAVLVALLAIAIGTVKQTKPELFFKIPNVGFILWAITGGNMPPYFSFDAWQEEEMKTWIKDGDLVVATAAKSGTTWMLYCSHQIRTKGSDSIDFRDVSISTPWPDLVHKPGMTWAEQKPLLNTTVLADGTKLKDYWDNPSFPFRIWKSHGTPKNIPVKKFPKVKFLTMARNGLDVVNSLIPFFDQHSDMWREQWGGFPPKASGDIVKDREARVNDLLPGGLLAGLYFDYITEWWPLRNEPNVLFLHYADAVKDLSGTVKKIADFVGVSLSSAEHKVVVEKCGMKHMKSVTHMFTYAVPLNKEFNDRDGRIMTKGAMTRKGGVGEGKSTFSEEQIAKWQAAEEKMLVEPGMLTWAREGGAVPA